MSRIATIYLAFILGVMNYSTCSQVAYAASHVGSPGLIEYLQSQQQDKDEAVDLAQAGITKKVDAVLKKVGGNAGLILPYTEIVKFSRNADAQDKVNFGTADENKIIELLSAIKVDKDPFHEMALRSLAGTLAASCESGVSEPVSKLVFQALETMRKALQTKEKLTDAQYERKMATAYEEVYKDNINTNITELGRTVAQNKGHDLFTEIIKKASNPLDAEKTYDLFTNEKKVSQPQDKLLFKVLLMTPDFQNRISPLDRIKYRSTAAEIGCPVDYEKFLKDTHGITADADMKKLLVAVRKNHTGTKEFKEAGEKLFAKFTNHPYKWGYPEILEMLANPLNPLMLSQGKIEALKSIALFNIAEAIPPTNTDLRSLKQKVTHLQPSALDAITALYTNRNPEKIADLKTTVYDTLAQQGLTTAQVDTLLKQPQFKLPGKPSTEFVSTFTNAKPDTDLAATKKRIADRMTKIDLIKPIAEVMTDQLMKLRSAAAKPGAHQYDKDLREKAAGYIAALAKVKDKKGKPLSGLAAQVLLHRSLEAEQHEKSPLYPYESQITQAFNQEAAAIAYGHLSDDDKALFNKFDGGTSPIFEALRGGKLGILDPTDAKGETTEAFKTAWARFMDKAKDNKAKSYDLMMKLIDDGYFPPKHANVLYDLLKPEIAKLKPGTHPQPTTQQPAQGKNEDFALHEDDAEELLGKVFKGKKNKALRDSIEAVREHVPYNLTMDDLKGETRLTDAEKRRLVAASASNQGNPGPGAWKFNVDKLKKEGNVEKLHELIKAGYFPPAQLIALKKQWPALFKDLTAADLQYNPKPNAAPAVPPKVKPYVLPVLKPVPQQVKIGGTGDKKPDPKPLALPEPPTNPVPPPTGEQPVWGLPAGTAQTTALKTALGECLTCHQGNTPQGGLRLKQAANGDFEGFQRVRAKPNAVTLAKVNGMIEEKTGIDPNGAEAALIRRMFGLN